MECQSGGLKRKWPWQILSYIYLDVAKKAMKNFRSDTQLVGEDTDRAPTYEKQGNPLLCKTRTQKLLAET
jgi:hypothetical protein